MTRLGKILVFVNLVFSVVLAGIALGIFTNHIDWVGVPPNQSEGEIKKREAELTTLKDLFNRNVTRWQREYAELPRQEQSRRDLQAWYAQQLEAVRQGPAQPIKVLTFANGALALDQQERPQLGQAPNAGWLPIRSLDEQLAATDQQITATAKDIQGTITQEQALSLVLNGGQGVPNGLRKLLAETREAVRGAEQELQHVKKLRINGKEDTGSLLNRQRQLRARLDLLKKGGRETARLP